MNIIGRKYKQDHFNPNSIFTYLKKLLFSFSKLHRYIFQARTNQNNRQVNIVERSSGISYLTIKLST